MGQFETALQDLSQELDVSRRSRERSRELYSAAERLTLEDAPGSIGARAVLHREGVLLALRALAGSAELSPAELWSSAASKPGLLTGPEGGTLRRLLLDSCGEPSAVETERLREVHLEFLEYAETALRRVQSLRVRRVRLLGGAALVAILLVVAGSWALMEISSPRNLARGSAWRTSSTGLECKPKEHLCGRTRTDILFHTNNEQDPWFELDLGSPLTFSAMTIRNRMDMGVARAVPLLVEVTDDHVTWREVIRRVEPFSTWTPIFPPTTARYVRLRVLKKTWFHLEDVEVHP